MSCLVELYEWKEAAHPRATDGKWTTGAPGPSGRRGSKVPTFMSGSVNKETAKLADKHGALMSFLVTPATKSNLNKVDDYASFGVDNGGYGGKFNPGKFASLLDDIVDRRLVHAVTFVAAPDVFDHEKMKGYPLETIEKSMPWFQRIRDRGLPPALVAQDGLEQHIDKIPWDEFDVLFFGGGDDFKEGLFGGPDKPQGLFDFAEKARDQWDEMVAMAREKGKRIHVGRVNSPERLLFAYKIGADSVDGNYITFAPRLNAPDVDKWIQGLRDRETGEALETIEKIGGKSASAMTMDEYTDAAKKMQRELYRKPLLYAAAWDEAKHPRADDGKFGSGGGAVSGPEKDTGHETQPAQVFKHDGGGQLTLMQPTEHTDDYYVGKMWVPKEGRGQGQATAMIMAAAKEAHANGKPLRSGRLVGPESKGLWKKLVDDGVAVPVSDPSFKEQQYQIKPKPKPTPAKQTETPEFKARRTKDMGGQSDPDHNPAMKSAGKSLKQFGYSRDNPGGDWLAGHKKRAREAAKDGRTVAGSITAEVPKLPVSVDKLIDLPGQNNEHRDIPKSESSAKRIDKLAASISKDGYDPDRALLLWVNVDGKPSIAEGNHRIRAAKQAGVDTIPVHIMWFAGAEANDGKWGAKAIAKQSTASGNKGTFDPDNPNINYSRLGQALPELYVRWTESDHPRDDSGKFGSGGKLTPKSSTGRKLGNKKILAAGKTKAGKTPGKRLLLTEGSRSGYMVWIESKNYRQGSIVASWGFVFPTVRKKGVRGGISGEGGSFEDAKKYFERRNDADADAETYARSALPELYRHKPAAGQTSFAWDEDKHPRADDGKFAEKEGSGYTSSGGKQNEHPETSSGQGDRRGLPEGSPLGEGARPSHDPALAEVEKGSGGGLPELADSPDGRRVGGDVESDLGRRDKSRPSHKDGEDRPVPSRRRRSRPALGPRGGDFRYASTDFVGGGLKTKFKQNLAAMKTLRAMRDEGRESATAAEQDIVSKFNGWGQFPGLFGTSYDWNKERKQLKEVLTDDEYSGAKDAAGDTAAMRSARGAILNSHFTSPQIVQAHWKMAQRLGFDGGRFLDPSIGSGYYVGMMPAELAGKTSVSGVELDTTTAAVAQCLYPSANVKNQGFENFKSPDGFYDLIASNVPFGDYAMHEPRYSKFNAPIHDHFFLKSVDKVRPGGLVMHVTSTGTMDKKSDRIRKELASKADLISAIRMPGGTHGDAAGTEVVTDMLIFRKHPEAGAAPAETPGDVSAQLEKKERGFTGVLTDSLGRVYHFVDGKRVPADDWMDVVDVPDPAGGDDIPVNKYFVDRPEQILGTLDRTGVMRAADQVNVSRTDDFDERLEAAIERLPEGIYSDALEPTSIDRPETAIAGDDVRPGQYVIKDGAVWQQSAAGGLIKIATSAVGVERIEAMNGIRQPLLELVKLDLAGEDSSHFRKQIGTAYDEFVKAHGPLHKKENIREMQGDPDLPLLLSLENSNAKTGEATKADIFAKNTISADNEPTSAANVPESIGLALSFRGAVDIDYMAQLTGQTSEEVEDSLRKSGLAFDDPGEGWKPRAEYLSGHVRAKLEQARIAADIDPRYTPNVEALEKNQPVDLEYTDISAKLGVPWMPGDVIQDFAAHLTGASGDDYEIKFTPELGTWDADYRRGGNHWISSNAATKQWGTDEVGFMTLLSGALNSKSPNIWIDMGDGNKELNIPAMDEAKAKQQEMREEFEEWLWEDDDRRESLTRQYNDTANDTIPMKYDGSHLTFPGIAAGWEMRPPQSNFVWQVITRGRGVLAHEVGLGKTAAMIAGAMELRRLGLNSKPAIAVLKSNIAQFTQEAQELYPGAKILSTDGQFSSKQRKEMVARIATGDYDMVILTHDHLNMLPMAPEIQAKYIQEEINELMTALGAAEADDSSKKGRTVKQLEKRRKTLDTKLKNALESKKDDAVTFEQTGIDFLMVDEAHMYKNLQIHSAMQELSGIPTQSSNRAASMLMRTRYLQEKNGNGRGVVFATGTPISNTMAEMYNIQKYIQPDELKARGMETFDTWAHTFGEYETALEPDLKGGYKTKTRFSKFVNVPELMTVTRQDLDVQRVDMQLKPDGSQAIKRPEKIDQMVVTPRTDAVAEMMNSIGARAREIAGQRVEKGKDNMLSLNHAARQGSVDVRLFSADAPDEPTSKVNQCVRNVLQRYHDSESSDQTQLIFSDIGVNPSPKTGFHLYKDIIDKLVAGGIPRDEIADFSKLEGAKRQEAAQKLKSGVTKIGIGSTQKLGTGNNVQNHIGALHHLDVPYVPTAFEQRTGRAFRFGNKNSSGQVQNHFYITQGSADEMSFGITSRKSGFITQTITGQGGQRTFSEEDAENLTPQQLMAAASGDLRAVKRINLKRDVKILRTAKTQHDKQQRTLKSRIEKTRSDITDLEKRAKDHQHDATHLAGNKEFHLSLDEGHSHTDRKEAAAALTDVAHDADTSQGLNSGYGWTSKQPKKIGSYRGMDLFRGGGTYTLKGPSDQTYRTGDSLASIEAVASRIGSKGKQATKEAKDNRSLIESMSKRIGKKFTKAADLDKADKALKALEKDMKENASSVGLEDSGTVRMQRTGQVERFDRFAQAVVAEFYRRKDAAGQGTFDFKEADHPRASDGKFTDGPQGGSARSTPTRGEDKARTDRQAVAEFAKRVDVGQVMQLVQDGLGEAGAGTIRERHAMRERFSAALGRMSAGAVARVRKGLGSVRFFDSVDKLSDNVRRAYGSQNVGGGVFGGVFVHAKGRGHGKLLGGMGLGGDKGALWINGDYSEQQRPPKEFGPTVPDEVYAHEIGHVVDGTHIQGEISGGKPWMNAYNDEIILREADGNAVRPGKATVDRAAEWPLSMYAASSNNEAWAEFARLVWSDPETAERDFPKCWAVWKDNDLV